MGKGLCVEIYVIVVLLVLWLKVLDPMGCNLNLGLELVLLW